MDFYSRRSDFASGQADFLDGKTFHRDMQMGGAATLGLKRTFETLASTENEAAVRVLIHALDSPVSEASEGALSAILERGSLAGETEVLRRLHTINSRWQAILNERRGRMGQALRNAILDTDPQMSANGCQAILWFHEYDLVPALINALEDDSNPNARLAAETLLKLAGLLYEELAAPRDYRERRDPQLVRRHVVHSLEQSVERYQKHRRKEIIEAFLLLTPRDSALLRQILHDPRHPSYLALVDTLLHSDSPGVMRLLLSHLDDPHPPSAALHALAKRGGRKFIAPLLRKIGFEPSPVAAQNLKRIDSIPWMRPEEGIVEELDDAGQHSAVKLLMASSVKRSEAYRTIEYLVRHGKPAGRRAAVEALADFQGVEANQLGLTALDDKDPLVQAAAVRQLRQRGIPGVLPRLIELAETGAPAVQEAVREALSEFRFSRFLAAFDMLDEEVRRSTGSLVKKIDPETIPLLVEEMSSAVRVRRTRAIKIAVAVDAVGPLQDKLIELTHDDDHLVRLDAVKALATIGSAAAVQAIANAQFDSSVPVQQEAIRSLAELQGRSLRTADDKPARARKGRPNA